MSDYFDSLEENFYHEQQEGPVERIIVSSYGWTVINRKFVELGAPLGERDALLWGVPVGLDSRLDPNEFILEHERSHLFKSIRVTLDPDDFTDPPGRAGLLKSRRDWDAL